MDPNEMKKAIASVAQDDKALAELIMEYIQPNNIPTDMMSLLLNTRALDIGDSLVKRVREGGTVHTYVPGSIHPKSEITVRDNIMYNLDGAIIEVTYNAGELRAGHIGSVESIRQSMLRKISDYYMGKVFTMLSNIWTISNNDDNYTSVGGALGASDLKGAIDNLNINSTGAKVVFGSRAALTPITTFGAGWDIGSADFDRWAVNSNMEEIMRTGWLGRYYGVPIVAFDQVYDNIADHNPLLPTDKVIVVAHDVGDFITYGPVESDGYEDKRFTPSQFVLKAFQNFGFLVTRAEGIHVLGDITPS